MTSDTELKIRPQRTVEDLLAEMEAWIDGNPDDHDKIIEAYKRHMTMLVVGRQDPQEPPLEDEA